MNREQSDAPPAPGAQVFSAKHLNIASRVMAQVETLRNTLVELEKLREEHVQAGQMTDGELQVAGSTTQHLSAFLVESFLDNVVGGANGLTAWYNDAAHPEHKNYILQILP